MCMLSQLAFNFFSFPFFSSGFIVFSRPDALVPDSDRRRAGWLDPISMFHVSAALAGLGQERHTGCTVHHIMVAARM